MGLGQDARVAVVGGGPVGLAAALALGRLGVSVTHIAPPHRPPHRPAHRPAEAGGDTRTAALFGGSIELLVNLGVWPACRAQSEPITAIRIIDDTGGLLRAPEVVFTAREIGLDAFGYNVPNQTLTSALAEEIRKHAGNVEIRDTSGVAHIDIGPKSARLTLDDGSSFEATLVVGADGRNSISRQSAGIETKAWSYPQAALVCSFMHQRPHGGISTELHRPAGPFTVVPLPGSRSSLVWVETPEEAGRLATLPESDFRTALEAGLQGLLGAVGEIGPRACFPLSGLSADVAAHNRVALAGEAAHVIPPIGAQGLNLGMRDVATLADCVVGSIAAGNDIGGAAALESYALARQADITARVWGIDLLNRSLIAGMLPAHLARGFGLHALAAFGPLRRWVVKEGLQPSYALPVLMQPGGFDTLTAQLGVDSAAPPAACA